MLSINSRIGSFWYGVSLGDFWTLLFQQLLIIAVQIGELRLEVRLAARQIRPVSLAGGQLLPEAIHLVLAVSRLRSRRQRYVRFLQLASQGAYLQGMGEVRDLSIAVAQLFLQRIEFAAQRQTFRFLEGQFLVRVIQFRQLQAKDRNGNDCRPESDENDDAQDGKYDGKQATLPFLFHRLTLR